MSSLHDQHREIHFALKKMPFMFTDPMQKNTVIIHNQEAKVNDIFKHKI